MYEYECAIQFFLLTLVKILIIMQPSKLIINTEVHGFIRDRNHAMGITSNKDNLSVAS